MYDHNKKAGNQGDVIKHTSLIAVASEIMKTCGSTFHYADTFAGYAYNPLKHDGEWRNGIEKFLQSDRHPDNEAICFWRSLWECPTGLRGSIYPGSSLFMLKLCMAQGLNYRARLWDISPAVISQLLTFHDPAEVEIITRSATVEDFSHYQPDLLLIDPPGFFGLEEWLEQFELVKNAILWLPITFKDGVEVSGSVEAFGKCRERGLPVISVQWDSDRSTHGCRLMYKLQDNNAQLLGNIVQNIAGRFNWSVSRPGKA